jgi:AcrR family transcriptional regulator
MTPRHKKTKSQDIMQETRQCLLDAAAEEFALHGFDKANVNRIADAAGFSIGTLYNYFPTKRDLMNAFIDETAQLHVIYILERVENQKNPGQRIKAFYQAGFEFIETHLTPSRAIFNTLNGPDESFREQLFQAYMPLFQILGQDIVGLGIQQGEFRPVDPFATANLLMLIYLGVGSQHSPQGKTWVSAQLVSDFVLHSLEQK